MAGLLGPIARRGLRAAPGASPLPAIMRRFVAFCYFAEEDRGCGGRCAVSRDPEI